MWVHTWCGVSFSDSFLTPAITSEPRLMGEAGVVRTAMSDYSSSLTRGARCSDLSSNTPEPLVPSGHIFLPSLSVNRPSSSTLQSSPSVTGKTVTQHTKNAYFMGFFDSSGVSTGQSIDGQASHFVKSFSFQAQRNRSRHQAFLNSKKVL